jgi:hypothetical protein
MDPAWLIGAEADIDWSDVKGSASTGGAIHREYGRRKG